MSNAKTKLQSRLPRDIFEVLIDIPVDPNDRLVVLEDKLIAGEFDEKNKNKRLSSLKKSSRLAKIDIEEFKKACEQSLTWEQMAKHFNLDIPFLREYAKLHGINRIGMKRGRKPIGETALSRKEYNRRYYDKNSPSVEELDEWMKLYKGFIGMLAFKLEKSFQITRNMLKFRGVYKKWLSYNKKHCWETCGKS